MTETRTFIELDPAPDERAYKCAKCGLECDVHEKRITVLTYIPAYGKRMPHTEDEIRSVCCDALVY